MIFDNITTLTFKNINELKETILGNFEDVVFDESQPNISEIEPESDYEMLGFNSKYNDYLIYYVITKRGNLVVVDSLKLNK